MKFRPLFLTSILLVAGCLLLPATAAAATPTLRWTGASNANWNIPANWDLQRLPAIGDHVGIDGPSSHRVVLNVSASIASLQLGVSPGATQTLVLGSGTSLTLGGDAVVGPSGVLAWTNGTVQGAGTLIVDGSVFWAGGTRQGPVAVGPAGRWHMSGPVGRVLGATPDPSPFTNRGLVTWQGAPLFVQHGNRIENRGEWWLEGDGRPFDRSSGQLGTNVNRGRFGKIAGTGTATITDIWFHNAGTIANDSGTITFSSGVNWDDGSILTGPGTNRHVGADLIAGGRVVVDGPFEWSSGTLRGHLRRDGSGPFRWLGGTLAGAITVLPGRELTLGGASRVMDSADAARPAAITNLGLVVWSGGPLFVNHGGHIENLGEWQLQGDGRPFDRSVAALGRFANRGVLHRSTGTGSVTLRDIELDHFGLISSSAGGTLDHALVARWFPGSRLGGSGRQRLVGNTVTLGGSNEIAAPLELTSGTLAGRGEWGGPGPVTWTAATLSGELSTAPSLALTFAGSGGRVLSSGNPASPAILRTRGPVAHTNSGALFLGSSARVENFGEWRWLSDVRVTDSAGAPRGVWINHGRFEKAPLSGTLRLADVSFTNRGVVVIPRGELLVETADFSAGELEIGVAGPVPLTDHGRVRSGQNPVFNCRLRPALAPGFTPAVGQGFLVVASPARVGTFTSFDGEPASGLAWTAAQYREGIRLLAAPAGLPSGLVAWFPGEGTAQDMVGAHHGSLQSGAGFGPGKVGQAFQLDGVNDAVDLGIWTPGRTWSLGAWVQAASLPASGRRVIAGGINACNDWALALQNGRFLVTVPPTNAGVCSAGFAARIPADTNWHHLVATCDGVTVQFWQDGQFQTSGPVRLDYVASDDGPRIGRAATGTDFFHGRIDDVVVFERVISAAEISALYNNGNGGSPLACVNPGANLRVWLRGEGDPLNQAGNPAGAWQGTAAYTPGPVGTALRLDGQSHVTVPDSPATRPGGGFTLDGWVWLDQPGPQVVAGKAVGGGTDNSYALFTSSGQWRAVVGGTFLDGGLATTGAWHHLALTFDAAVGRARLFHNGSEVAAATGASPPAYDDHPLRIGADLDNGLVVGRLLGAVDEVALNHRALTDGEIALLAAGAVGRCLGQPVQADCVAAPPGAVVWLPAEGTPVNAAGGVPPEFTAGTGFQPGIVGQSLVLDGAGGVVRFPDAAAVRFTNFTIEGWFTISNPGSPVVFVAKALGVGTDNSYALYATPGVLRGHAGGHEVAAGFQPEPGRWYHLAHAVDLGNRVQKLYIDGVPVAAGGTPETLLYDDHPVLIGADINAGLTGLFLAGGVDELAMYPRVLDAAEVHGIFAAGGRGKCPPGSLFVTALAPQPFATADFDHLVVTWNTAVDAATFGGDDVALVGPLGTVGAGEIAVAPAVPGDTRVFRIGFPVQTREGSYVLTLGTNILDAFGRRAAAFAGGFILDKTGPRVTNATPAGVLAVPPNRITLSFDSDLAAGSVALADFAFTGSGAPAIASVTRLNSRQLRVNLAAPLPPGTFALSVGPGITDLAGNLMDQDSNGVPGEPGDRFTTELVVQLADLAVTEVSSDPVGDLGQSLRITFTVTNRGANGISGPWHHGIWFATNSTGDGAVSAGQIPFNGSLAAGTGLTFTQLVIVPTTVPGLRFAGVEADSLQVVAEPDETNNLRYAPSPVTLRAADLVVESLGASAGAVLGSTATLEFVIFNAGDGTAASPFRTRCWLSDSPDGLVAPVLLATVTTGPLAAGGRMTNTVAITLPLAGQPVGDRFLVVDTDVFREQPELREDNNRLGRAIALERPPLPDLAGHELTAPASVRPLDPVPLVLTLTNRGSLATTRPFTLQLAVLNTFQVRTLLDLRVTNSVPSGGALVLTQLVVAPADLAAGPSTFHATVDRGGEIIEVDEANNSFSASETSTVSPALVITGGNDRVSEGGTITMVVRRNSPATEVLVATVEALPPGQIEPIPPLEFPAGVAVLSVSVRGLVDGLVDGDAAVTLSALAPGHVAVPGGILVRDIDVPGIRLVLETNRVTEGLTVGLTVGRTARTNEVLEVILASGGPLDLLVPPVVTLPPGAHEVAAAVLAFDDLLIEPGETVTFTATAAGFTPASATIDIADNDLPVVTVNVAPGTLAENGGPVAGRLTVTRSPVTAQPVTVDLVSSDPSALLVPASVTIPANQASALGFVAAVDDALVDGDQPVHVTGSIRASGTAVQLASVVPAMVTVTDDDGPTLRVDLSRATVAEGLNPAAVVTVTRNTAPDGPLTVDLASSDSTEATVPPGVVLPAGVASVTASLASVSDGVTDGSRVVVITATAPGFAPGTRALVVTDIDRPDLVVTRVTAPATADTDGSLSISWRLENQGIARVAAGVPARFAFSTDPLPGNDTLAGEFVLPGELPPGGFLEQTTVLRAPAREGRYWLVVTSDPAGAVAEGDEGNNTGITAQPIEVTAAYTATVSTEFTAGPIPASIPLTGSAVRRGGGPAAGVPVDIHVAVRGTLRTLRATTDAAGDFSARFVPLPGEAGRYVVGATHPGTTNRPAQDSFTLFGVALTPFSPGHALIAGQSVTGLVRVVNRGDAPLTGLTASVASAPPGIQVMLELEAAGLPGLGETTLRYVATTDNSLSGLAEIRVRIESAESAAAESAVFLILTPPIARLATDPSRLDAVMVRDGQTLVNFTVYNSGGVTSGPVSIAIPPAPWLAVVSQTPLPPLPPGGSNTVTLRLAPAADLALGAYPGNLVVRDGRAPDVAVPFTFRHLSEARGDLMLEVTDEFTFYAEGGPRVVGARLQLRDLLADQIITNGVSDAQGRFTFLNLPESHYVIEAAAEGHGGARVPLVLAGGRTNLVEVFLPRETVRYRWVVAPTTVDDTTRLVLETTFETFVPIPVVTIEPSLIDLAGFTGSTQVNLTLRNHGLIAAPDYRLTLPSVDGLRLTALVTEIGDIPAQQEVIVPLVIERAADGGGRERNAKFISLPCDTSLYGCFNLPCGGRTRSFCDPVFITSIRADCRYFGPGTDPLYFPFPPRVLGDAFGIGAITGGRRESVGAGLGQAFGSAEVVTEPTRCSCSEAIGLAGCNVRPPAESLAGPVKRLGQQVDSLRFLTLLEEPKLIDPFAHTHPCRTSEGPGEIFTGGGGILLSAEFRVPLAGVEAGGRLHHQGTDIDYHYVLTEDLVQRFNFAGGVRGSSGCGLADLSVCASARPTTAIEAEVRLPVVLRLSRDGVPAGEFTQEVPLRIEAGFAAELLTCLTNTPEPVESFRAFARGQTSVSAEGETISLTFSNQLLEPVGPPLPVESAGGTPAGASPLDSHRRGRAAGDGICARVRLRINQDLVLARQAFEATLEIENDSGSPLENLAILVDPIDADGFPAGDRFGVRTPALTGLGAVDGTGTLSARSTGRATFVLIPASTAAPDGARRYGIGGRLVYRQDGRDVTIPLFPAPITVEPDPRLAVTYFLERDVFSDDPFTDEVEPAVPFSLAVLVHNRGRGDARNVRIISSQPEIIENERGLLIEFKIIGSEVDGQPRSPSLTAEFGHLPAGTNGIARWLLTSSLHGLFIDYTAAFEHTDSLGNTNLSLVDEVSIHEMIHVVRAPGAWEDGRLDFLVNDLPDDADLPDAIYLSDTSTQAVASVTVAVIDGPPTAQHPVVRLTAVVPPGFVYLRVPEPSDGRRRLVRCRRPDGRELLLGTNVWITDRTFVGNSERPVRENTLHLFDDDSAGEYLLTYEELPSPDTEAPVSAVAGLPAESYAAFTVAWEGSDAPGGALAGFDVLVSTDGGPFVPWLVGTQDRSGVFLGEHGRRYAFFSLATDAAGNREAPPVVPDAVTTVTRVNAPPTLAAPAPVVVDEGQVVTIPLSAGDPDPGQKVFLSLAADAPAGVLLTQDPARLVWLTAEANGPATHEFSVLAVDNGLPSLTATTRVTIVVNEVNRPPELARLPDRVINEETRLAFEVQAADPDRPVQALTYLLAPGAPAGSVITPAGSFSWQPTALQGPSTNLIRVMVRDNGTPSLSATQAFTVTVRDTAGDFVVALGSNTVAAGESGVIPVDLASGPDVRALDFRVDVDPARVTGAGLVPRAPEVASVSVTTDGAGRMQVSVAAIPGMTLAPGARLADLTVTTAVNQRSAFVPLLPAGLLGFRATGEPLTDGEGRGGRLVILGEEPLLELPRVAGGETRLLLHARDAGDYLIESTPTLGAEWTSWTNLSLTLTPVTVGPVPAEGAARFFRARRAGD